MNLGLDEQSTKPAAPEAEKPKTEEVSASETALVKRWTKRIKDAKEKAQADFDRMVENMDFVAGIQCTGQKSIKTNEYIVNMTLQAVNRGVAMLYARNPTVEARRRERMDYQLWDGKMETIFETLQQSQMMAVAGMPVPPQALALLQDFQQGKAREAMMGRIGKTLKIAYQYQMDSQQPRFKLQMKQLVRRVRVCGVGFIKVTFCRDYNDKDLTQSETRLNVKDRMALAASIMEKIKDGKVDESSAEIERLKSLVASLGMNPYDTENVSVKEHLVFDFPQATSIIVDPQCRALKGFVGAHWIAEEFYYPLEFVNAFFEKKIEPSSELKTFEGKKEDFAASPSGEKQDEAKRKVRLWQVYDLDTKSTFIICEGYKEYVLKPEAVEATKGFWNIFAVTFNDIEVEEGCKATIYPPSDVDQLKSVQREKNRIGKTLSRHRRANGPRYLYPEGQISEADIDRIVDSDDQEFIPIKGVQPGQEPSKVVQPLQVVDIKRELYDSGPLQEDALLASGQQEANIGPAQPNVTATVGSIAEQSRQSVAASDVDGFDDTLTDVAQCGGELLFREMSIDTIRKIVGPGAAWPEENKEDFLNEIELEVVAASSGRPNKAIEVQNWQQLAPLIMQAAQMPPQAQPTIQAVIRETLRRIDDRIDPSDFFPVPMNPMMAQQQQAQGVDPGASRRTPAKPKQLSAPAPNRPQ